MIHAIIANKTQWGIWLGTWKINSHDKWLWKINKRTGWSSMLQVWESLLEAPMIGGFYHRWERENEVRKQVMNCDKCWQEFQNKQNWNIIWRIPLKWLYRYARSAFVGKWHLSKDQSSEGFDCEYIHKKWLNAGVLKWKQAWLGD